MALKAPRTLNAPIDCRLSGLIHSGRSSSAHPAGTKRGAQDVGTDQFRRGADVIDGDQLHESSLPDGASVYSACGETATGCRTLDVKPRPANSRLKNSALTRWVGSRNSYFGPPNGFAMHQMLIAMAAIRAGHSIGKVDAVGFPDCQAQERRPGNPSQRPLPQRDPPLDGVFGLLSGLTPIAGRARRLPLLAARHEVRVAVITRRS